MLPHQSRRPVNNNFITLQGSHDKPVGHVAAFNLLRGIVQTSFCKHGFSFAGLPALPQAWDRSSLETLQAQLLLPPVSYFNIRKNNFRKKDYLRNGEKQWNEKKNWPN
jgi:hypothetical protein